MTCRTDSGSGLVGYISNLHLVTSRCRLWQPNSHLPIFAGPNGLFRTIPNSLNSLWELRPSRCYTVRDANRFGGIDAEHVHTVAIDRK